MYTSFAITAALLITAAPAAANDGNEVAHVQIDNVGSLQTSDAAKITIATTGAPDFTLFRLSNPTRVVVDLPGASAKHAKLPERTAKSDLVAAITATDFAGSAGSVGRVVIVLRGNVEFDAMALGNSVVVTAQKRNLKAQAQPARAQPAQSPAAVTPRPEQTDVVVLDGGPSTIKRAANYRGISAKAASGGSLVKISTDGEIARYEIEEVDNPPRLVVDLFGIKARRHEKHAFEAPAIARARVGKHHEKTRIVLDARDARGLPGYDVASTDEGLTILFNEHPKVQLGPRTKIGALNVEDKRGFQRVALDVERAVAVRTVKNAPREKTIALDGVTLSDALAREQTFDSGLVDSVRFVRGERDGTVHMVLSLNQEVDHSVWQKQGHLYWDVRRKDSAADANTSRAQPRAAGYATTLATAAHQGATAKRYKGRRMNIDLQDADIVNVIRLIGDVSGKNVVVGEDVKGRVTIKLRNVPWDQALDVILRTKQLGQEKRGGIIRVAPQARLDEESAARLKLQADREEKQPTTVRLIPVNYAVAKELVPQIKELLSKRGRVTFDERTNVIIVEDVRANLNQAEELVRTLDTQTPLVHIEARMVEAATTFTRSLGIQWGGGLFFSQRGGNPTGLIFPNNVGVAGGADNPQQAQLPVAGVTSPSNYAVNLPTENTTSAVGMNLGSIGNYGFLNARLSAAETNGDAKTISAPKVTTLNNKAAKISQGVQIPITTQTQNQVQTTVIDAKLELDVTPHVTADGSILMALLISNDAPQFNQTVSSGGQAVLPTISTKSVETEMLVQDGDTAVIGGIYTRSYGEVYNQVPFLGDIPLLGWLFKNYRVQDQRDEMLVFLTPRVINRSQ